MSKKNTQVKVPKVKVLYQNLNGVWYAFAEVNDNVFFGKVALKAKAPQSQSPAKVRRAPAKAV